MTRLSDLDRQGPMACGCYRVEVQDFGHGGACRIRGRRVRPGVRHGDPATDPPGTCRWRNPRDSGPWIKVADNRWVHVGGGGGQTDEVVVRWPVGQLHAPDGAHEVQCPGCGTTIRARMADAPAAAALARVRARHRRSPDGRCEECYGLDENYEPWPCPTIEDLDGDA